MIDNQGNLIPPFTTEELMDISLWISEVSGRIHEVESHFRVVLPDDHELKVQLKSLMNLKSLAEHDDIPSV